MKKSRLPIIGIVLLIIALSGCTPAATPVPPTSTSLPITPTWTPSPVPLTSTLLPHYRQPPHPNQHSTLTPIPGLVVFPVDTLDEEIPWLPLDPSNRPAVNYVAFNNLLPPFNNTLVRQAFAHAIDRQVLVEMVSKVLYKRPQTGHLANTTGNAGA